MGKMGYGDQPYVVFKHEDIDRHHLHIVSINVDKNGKKLDHNNDFYRSKQITRELEQKYGLRTAERKSKEEKQAFSFKRVDAERGNVKIQIGNIIKPLAATYHFQSFNEYRTLLAQYNICVEQSKGVRNGRSYEGLIYYATNDKGEKISNPFKSSLFRRVVGHKAINEKCEKSKQTIKDKRLGKQSAKRISKTIYGIKDKQEFIDRLKEQNIDVVFRENDAGRIYGATFIDHNNHSVFNGSRLGKEFSANAINDRFSNPDWREPLQQPQTEQTQESQQEQAEQQQQQPMSPQEQTYSRDDDTSFSMGGLLDLPADGADDPEETMFRKRMQRKKKKGRKL